ncbi:MAG: TolC family outer membrane protein, partial [Chromatiaceae bacterium]|nr:TolC family outer membrane protein [Candidatus Thioaporhodococcus sediminis]
ALRNPEVQARWHAYKEATEGIDVAKGAYRPRVDVSAEVAREWLDQRPPPVDDDSYTYKSLGAYLNQMLFDGWATKYEVKRLNYAQRAAFYDLVKVTEDIALETMRAYNDVLRYRKLKKLAEDNYVQHRAIFEQLQRRVKAGVGRRVDLEQASGRLALAESNLITESSNLHDVSARYQRIVGTLPPADMEELPTLKADIPETLRDSLYTAYKFNPGLLSRQEGIVSAQAGAQGTRSKFYPRLDLRASHTRGWDIDGLQDETRSKLGLLLNYNLYNGGSDKAQERQYWERVNIAKDLRDKECRDVRQTVTIAYNDIKKLTEQLAYLDQHQLATEKARDAYRKQFDIGQRTLLDVLDSENELFEARRAYTAGLHDFTYAYGRTQAGMGKLLPTIGVQNLETPNLHSQDEQAPFDPDTVCPPQGDVATAVDKEKLFADALAANPDLLPPEQQKMEAAPLLAPIAAPATAPAAPGDEDKDGVTDDKDKCPGTPAGTQVDQVGCPIKGVIDLKGVNFDLDKHDLRADALPLLDEAVKMFERYPDLKVEVAGHTDYFNTDEYNQALSERRAKAVMDYFVSKGIAADRLTAKGYGESQPVASNAPAEGQAKNRRVELRVIEK